MTLDFVPSGPDKEADRYNVAGVITGVMEHAKLMDHGVPAAFEWAVGQMEVYFEKEEFEVALGTPVGGWAGSSQSP